MSTTTSPAAAPASSDNWRSPQTIIALYGLTIGAGVLVGVFLLKDISPVQAGIAGTALGAALSPLAYYFGSSKSSQDKDVTVASIATTPKATP